MRLMNNLLCIFCYLQYRDIVRQFIKGTDGFAGAFAECLCGSPNLYQVYLMFCDESSSLDSASHNNSYIIFCLGD